MARAWARRPAARAPWFVALHGPPLLALAAFAAVTLPRMESGGGPLLAVGDVLRDTLAWTLGVPPSAAAAVGAALLVLAVVVADMRLLCRRGSDLWVFDLVAIVAPVLAIAAVRPPQLYPRYLLMSVTVFLLALGRVLAGVPAAAACPRSSARLCSGVLHRQRDAAGGVPPRWSGHYAETLRYVAERSAR